LPFFFITTPFADAVVVLPFIFPCAYKESNAVVLPFIPFAYKEVVLYVDVDVDVDSDAENNVRQESGRATG
jgi:hypothetical protein